MEMIQFVKGHIRTKDMRLKTWIVFATLVFLTAHLLHLLSIVKNIHVGNPFNYMTFRVALGQMVFQTILASIIYIWLYAAPKFYIGNKKLKHIIEQMTGVSIPDYYSPPQRSSSYVGIRSFASKETKLSYALYPLYTLFFVLVWIKTILIESIESFKYVTSIEYNNNKVLINNMNDATNVWNRQKRLSHTLPVKGDSWRAINLKLVYFICWFFISFYSIWTSWRIGFITRDGFGILTVILAVICQCLCYFSWWACVEFGYFIRMISKLSEIYNKSSGSKYRFNTVRPSQTRAYQALLHDSTMVSVVFLVISGMYALILFGMLFVGNVLRGNNADIRLFSLSVAFMLPSLISLIPVVSCPKIFLYRILKKWKIILIKEYEARNDGWKINKEDSNYTKMIDIVYGDRMKIHSIEIAGSIITYAMSLAAIIATLISLNS